MKNNLKKGFTLIELLVVVSIISILASVILASLNTARAKGVDAQVKSTMTNMRTEAVVYYNTYNTYNLLTHYVVHCKVQGIDLGVYGCDPNTLSGMKALAASTHSTIYANTNDPGDLYYISVPLTSVSGTYWCIDSTGKSESTLTASNANDFACP